MSEDETYQYEMNEDILKEATKNLFEEVDWCHTCEYDGRVIKEAPCNVCACLKIIFWEPKKNDL